jgi:hypothetical protein
LNSWESSAVKFRLAKFGLQIINGRPAKSVAIGSDEWSSSTVEFPDEEEEEQQPRRLN